MVNIILFLFYCVSTFSFLIPVIFIRTVLYTLPLLLHRLPYKKTDLCRVCCSCTYTLFADILQLEIPYDLYISNSLSSVQQFQKLSKRHAHCTVICDTMQKDYMKCLTDQDWFDISLEFEKSKLSTLYWKY